MRNETPHPIFVSLVIHWRLMKCSKMCVTHQSVMTRWLIWTLRRRLRESQKGFLDTSISASFLIKSSGMMYLCPVAIHNGDFVYCPLEISRDEDTADFHLWTCSMTRPVYSPVRVIFHVPILFFLQCFALWRSPIHGRQIELDNMDPYTKTGT